MNAQRDGHKGYKGRQQPNGGNCNDSNASCHPTAISAKKERGERGNEIKLKEIKKESHTFQGKRKANVPCSLRLPTGKRPNVDTETESHSKN